MTQNFKERFSEIAALLDLFCHANNFDVDGFRDQTQVERWLQLHPTFKNDFQKVIADRLITMDEHADLTDIDFETDDELFEYLQKIFDCVYNNGPDPYAIEQVST